MTKKTSEFNPFEKWMVQQNLDHARTEGAEAVVAQLRAGGYGYIAEAVLAASGQYEVGDVVAYEDRANPRTTYVVVGVGPTNQQYRLRNTATLEVEYSDCRQFGWTLVDHTPDEKEAT